MLIQEAAAAHRQGDLLGATSLLEAVLREHPNSTHANSAKRVLEKIKAARPSSSEVDAASPKNPNDLFNEATAVRGEALNRERDAAQKRQKRRTEGVTAMVLLGVCLLFYRGCIYESPEDAAKRVARENAEQCTDPVAVYVAAEHLVKRALKAPSTAKFPSMYELDSPVTVSGDTTEVHAYVDAQNGFGAMIRTNYTVKMSCDAKTATWTEESLNLE